MERIDLAGLEHTVTRQFRFTGGAVVRFGTAGEGWFAWHSRKGPAWVFRFERSAAELADQWLARGEWVEVDLNDSGGHPLGVSNPSVMSAHAARKRGA